MQSDKILGALAALEEENFSMGPAWNQAHEVAQSQEGEPAHDRLHALCHRIEGDAGNAAYWYRRAGTSPFAGDFREEAEALRADLGDGSRAV